MPKNQQTSTISDTVQEAYNKPGTLVVFLPSKAKRIGELQIVWGAFSALLSISTTYLQANFYLFAAGIWIAWIAVITGYHCREIGVKSTGFPKIVFVNVLSLLLNILSVLLIAATVRGLATSSPDDSIPLVKNSTYCLFLIIGLVQIIIGINIIYCFRLLLYQQFCKTCDSDGKIKDDHCSSFTSRKMSYIEDTLPQTIETCSSSQPINNFRRDLHKSSFCAVVEPNHRIEIQIITPDLNMVDNVAIANDLSEPIVKFEPDNLKHCESDVALLVEKEIPSSVDV